jgi:O-antigen/teichoic acid export membrane protein
VPLHVRPSRPRSLNMIFSRANISTFLTSVAIQVSGLITGVLTARILGPTARGELATVMLWPVILTNLGLMGCNWAVAREVAADPRKESDWIRAAVVVGFAAACLCLVLGYWLIPYLLPLDRRYLGSLVRLCLLSIPLGIFNQTLLGIEHGRMRWRRYNVVRVSFFVFYVILICLIAVNRRAQVQWFVWAYLASHAFTVIVRLVIQRESFASGKLHVPQCFRLLRCGLPYLWATASNLLTLQMDKILVISLMSTGAAGIYAVAVTFSNALSPLGEALGITSFAFLSNEKSVHQQGKILAETFRQATLASAGFGLLLSCFVPVLIKVLFGSEFAQAARPAVILTVAAALTTPSGILLQGLRGAGRPYPGLASQLLGTGVLAASAALLLPKFGLLGMAWAVVLSACFQVIVLLMAASALLRISLLRFWPFGARDVREFWQSVMAMRLRYSRSPA